MLSECLVVRCHRCDNGILSNLECIGTGTAIGGAVVSGPGIAWIGCAGGAIAVAGVILAITVMFPAIRRAKPVA